MDAAKKAGIEDSPAAMYAFLIERVRANLHIVLGMSPVGEPFRYSSSSLLLALNLSLCVFKLRLLLSSEKFYN